MSPRLAVVAAFTLSLLGARIAFAGAVPPTYDVVRAATRPSDLNLLDRHGRVLHEIRTDPLRRRFAWVALADVSPALRTAVVASEDRRFFAHGGVDFRAVLSAAIGRLTGGAPRGASTITMQLAALLDPRLQRGARPRSLRGKWQQMLAAWALEKSWSKAEILEAYLNLATFRGEVQGVGAASTLVYGKAPHALAGAEAAVLTALLRGPNATPPEVAVRAQAVLETLGVLAARDEIEHAVARATGDHGGSLAPAMAPHVAHRLLAAADDAVRSTLDLDVQVAAAAALRRALLALHDRRVSDGAVLAVDNLTGEILAYVGSSGGLSPAPHVDGVRARRQPGSALKPFLYSLAIDERLLTAASLLDDSPLEIAVATGLYRPENYDEQFRGMVAVRTALASSLNIPAVRALRLVGEQRFATHLRELGFAGLTRPGSYYGPALALGSAEVSLWEIVNAYRTLANGGEASPLRLVADTPSTPPRRMYSAATAFITSSILADREGRSMTFGLESPLSTRFWTAVKTGTSKDMRDNWCVGFSSRYTVGVWVGNFSGYPMGDVSGVTGAAPVWMEIMQWLHRDQPSREPSVPAGVVQRAVRVGATRAPRREWFLDGTAPAERGQRLALQPARIVAPAESTIIAIDPEIPLAQQRIVFEAVPGDAPVTWVLDGTALGSSATPLLWPLVAGRHELLLIDDRGQTVDRIAFFVRGTT